MKEFWPYLLITLLACLGIWFFQGQHRPARIAPQTYDQYRANSFGSIVDPVGAQKILVKTSQTRDGFESLWRFEISEANLGVLAKKIWADQNGEKEIAWECGNFPPETWQPQSELPLWWQETEFNPDSKSVNWCFSLSSDGQHEGWFISYDRYSSTARIWNWNHQWAAAKCPDATPTR